MSGIDEQIGDIPDCPNCGKRPAYWTLSNESKVQMCQIYSKRWSLVDLRGLSLSGDTVGFFTGYRCIADVVCRLGYAWCRECGTAVYDRTFLKHLINVAKRLEKIKYGGEE